MLVIDDSMVIFRASIKSKVTRKEYERNLNRFLKETDLLTTDKLLKLGRDSPNKLSSIIIDLILTYKERVEKGELTSSAIFAWYAPVKLFLTMNDLTLNWDKLSRMIPRQGKADDRAIEINEIKKMLKFASVRDKALVLLLASSGIRIGAVPSLNIKHVCLLYTSPSPRD